MKNKNLKTWRLTGTERTLTRQQAVEKEAERKAMRNEWFLLIAIVVAIILLNAN